MINKFGLPAAVITALNDIFGTYPEIETVVIFGSRALGTFRPASDIDLCLIAPHLTLQQQLMLENQIDDLLLPWKVDVLLQHKIDNLELLAHISRAGMVFYR